VNKLATRLRIGEKIGLGFGLVGLIFLGVIWHYHGNLRDILAAQQELTSVYGARQARAFAIESRLTAMRGAGDRFLLTRDTAFAEQAQEQAAALRRQAELLADIDTESRRTAEQISALSDEFAASFEAIVEAWRTRGLDEDSGLQGAFREAVHELEERAGHYNADRLYLLLMQTRRSEKDLGLRREAQYHHRAQRLLTEMETTLAASALRQDTRQALAAEIATYRRALDDYARTVLGGGDIDGGKGPFRDAAHRIEALLEAHYVPDLEARVLQMRRREKDYLLRGDERYVAMVDEIATDIRDRIAASAVADGEKAQLEVLLDGYLRDFHALVDQDKRIAGLTDAMYQAAGRITPLVEANLNEATAQLERRSAEIAEASAERARWSLIVAGLAALLGSLLAVLITLRIVRPVRAMAGLLDRLTRENPSDRIPTDPAGRDEINAMAIALNTMADHKAKFFDWWRSSMQEAIAVRDLEQARTDDERVDAAQELRAAASAKLEQLHAVRDQLLAEVDRVDQVAGQLGDGEAARRAAGALHDAAADLRTLIRIVDSA
jgi:methyl-accepting chemotaxis protein